MSEPSSRFQKLFEMENGFCIEVTGADAGRVVNNLCTNDVLQLPVAGACEAFITNVRGWVVAHVVVARLQDRIWVLGQHPQPDEVLQHLDRYIIVEDATVALRPRQVLLWATTQSASPEADRRIEARSEAPPWTEVFAMEGGWILVLDASHRDAVLQMLQQEGALLGSAEEGNQTRIQNFWPAHGREILEKTIPQELDRNLATISFTKGCYLGQETIARLDARGQLQRKLCLMEIDSSEEVDAGTVVLNGEKEVGRLTSVAQDGRRTYALAYLRRGAFDVGQELECASAKATVVSV